MRRINPITIQRIEHAGARFRTAPPRFDHSIMSAPNTPPPAVDPALLLEVAQQIVAALNLETAAADIDPDAPLYGEGLGLDSIDILEIALVLSKRYGLQLRSDDANNHVIFRSLRNLAAYVAEKRTR